MTRHETQSFEIWTPKGSRPVVTFQDPAILWAWVDDRHREYVDEHGNSLLRFEVVTTTVTRSPLVRPEEKKRSNVVRMGAGR